MRKRLFENFDAEPVQRFIDDWRDSMMGVAKEAMRRERKEILSFKDYNYHRYIQGVMIPFYDLIECVFGFVLPDEVRLNPIFEELRFDSAMIVLYANVSTIETSYYLSRRCAN